MATALPRQAKSKAGQPGQASRGLSLQAVQREDTASMESLMAGDVDVNAVTSTGMTPLISAAANGHLGTVRALLKRGAAVNQKRNDGFAALALASFFGHEQVVRELLSHGADVEAKDKSGTSAEMWAEVRNHITISDLLSEIRERSLEMVSPEIVPVSETIPSQPSSHPSPTDSEPQMALAGTVPVSETILTQPSPQPSPSDKDIEDLDETTIIRQRTETIEVKTGSADMNEAGFPEGSIRRVGGIKSATTSPMMALEDRVNEVAAFSPFSALVDRLSTSWTQVAVVMLVVMLLSGVVTFAALKAIGRKAKPSPPRAVAGTSDLPAESAQPASIPNQPATPLPDAQTKTSVEVPTVEGSPDEIQPLSSDDATTSWASHSRPDVVRDLASGRAAGLETKRRAGKPKSQYRNQSFDEVAKSPHTTRRRSESMSFDGDGNGSTGPNEPAAIKIVSEPPGKQVRKASPAKEIQTQPIAPLEGPSTKRKVIQWP